MAPRAPGFPGQRAADAGQPRDMQVASSLPAATPVSAAPPANIYAITELEGAEMNGREGLEGGSASQALGLLVS